jgi:hypothetical protein
LPSFPSAFKASQGYLNLFAGFGHAGRLDQPNLGPITLKSR